jgi:hypothetical protein
VRGRVFVHLCCWAGIVASCANAQLTPATGINSLAEVPFAHLTQQDRNLLGAKALAINAGDWKHAETEHFIYHYQRSYVATPVAVEAEFHFRVALKELGKTDVGWTEKAHIYIFEKPADWESFQTAGQLEPWTGGIQSGSSLFIVRNPAYKFTDNTLGHEVVHLMLRRLYGSRVPLWLNEGMAQCFSKNAHASYQRARGYLAKPSSNGVAAEKLFPLSRLTTMSYPPAAEVETFYDQSERLVRFLIAADRQMFLALLQAAATGDAFEAALSRSTAFPSLAALEEQFRTYATKDAKTVALQDR